MAKDSHSASDDFFPEAPQPDQYAMPEPKPNPAIKKKRLDEPSTMPHGKRHKPTAHSVAPFYSPILTQWVLNFKARKVNNALYNATSDWIEPLDMAQSSTRNTTQRQQERHRLEPFYLEDVLGRPLPPQCSTDIATHATNIRGHGLFQPIHMLPSERRNIAHIAVSVRIIAALYRQYRVPEAKLLSEADILWIQIVLLYDYMHSPQTDAVPRRIRCRDYLIGCGMDARHAWIYASPIVSHNSVAMPSILDRIFHDVIVLRRLGKEIQFILDDLYFYRDIVKNNPAVTGKFLEILSELYRVFPQADQEMYILSIASRKGEDLSVLKKIICPPQENKNDHIHTIMSACHAYPTLAPLYSATWNHPKPLSRPDIGTSSYLCDHLYTQLRGRLNPNQAWLHHTTTVDSLMAILDNPDSSSLLGMQERNRHALHTKNHTPEIGGVQSMVFAGMALARPGAEIPVFTVPHFVKKPANLTILWPIEGLTEQDPRTLANLCVSQHLATYRYQHNSTVAEGENTLLAGDVEFCTRKQGDGKEFYTQDHLTRSASKPHHTLFRSTTPAQSLVQGWENIWDLCLHDMAIWLASLGADNPLTRHMLAHMADGQSAESVFNILNRVDRSEIKIPDQLRINQPGVILLFNEEPDPDLVAQIKKKWPQVSIMSRTRMATAMHEAAEKGDIAALAEGMARGYPLDGDCYHLAQIPYPLMAAMTNKQYETTQWLIEQGVHQACFKNRLVGATIYERTQSQTYMDMMLIADHAARDKKICAILEKNAFNSEALSCAPINAVIWKLFCYRAIELCRADVVDYLLQQPIASIVIMYKSNLCSSAMEYGNASIYTLLMRSGFRDHSLFSSEHVKSLKQAAMSHQSAVLLQQYRAVPTTDTVRMGKLLLLYAAQYGSLRGVTALIGEGVSYDDALDQSGNTLLHCAAGSDRPHIITYLCHLGTPLSDKKNKKNQTPLAIALLHKNWRSIRALCETGVQIEDAAQFTAILQQASRAHDGRFMDQFIEARYLCDATREHRPNPSTALIYAVRFGRLALVKKCIQQKHGNPTITWNGSSLLHLAIERKYPDIARYVIQYADINSRDLKQRTPLHLAIIYQELTLVRELLRLGAQPALYKKGNTLLHLAISTKSNLDMIKELASVTNMNATNEAGHTPLACAVIKSDVMRLRMLMDIGARPSLDKKGNTLLHLAIQKNTTAEMMAEIAPIIGLNTCNQEGLSPLQCAVTHQKPGALRILLQLGAQPAFDAEGDTLLHLAILQASSSEIIEVLADTIGINTPNEDGLTPLDFAFSMEETSSHVIGSLLKCGAAADFLPEGRTLIHLAVESGNIDILKEVLHCRPGIDINAKDRFGNSALSLAGEDEPDTIIINYLLANGAIAEHPAHELEAITHYQEMLPYSMSL